MKKSSADENKQRLSMEISYEKNDQEKIEEDNACMYNAVDLDDLHRSYDSSVKLICWESGKKAAGHVALKIISGYEYIYVSYWPSDQTCIRSMPGEFYTFASDEKNQYCTAITIDLSHLKLNEKKIIETFRKVQANANNKWSLLSECRSYLPCGSTNFHGNCGTLVMFLLEEGGIKAHLPSGGKFGSLKHIVLLSCSRVFITTSFLACGVYPIIEDNIGDDEHSGIALLSTVFIVLFNGIFVFLLEKKLAPREFVEMNYKDCVVGIGASLGFWFVALFDKWVERVSLIELLDENIFFKVGFDFILLTVGTLVGLYVGGKIASCFVSIICLRPLQGTAHTISPQNIVGWKKYIESANNEKVKTFVAKAEVSSMLMLYSSWITCFIVRHLGVIDVRLDDWFNSGIFALYVGVPFGIGISYLVTKYYITKLETELKKNLDEETTYKAIAEQHGQSLERYSFTTLTTAFGILSGVSLCVLFDDDLNDPLTTALLSSATGACGYIVGAGLYKAWESLRNLCKKTPVQEHININTSFGDNQEHKNITTSLSDNRYFGKFFSRVFSSQDNVAEHVYQRLENA